MRNDLQRQTVTQEDVQEVKHKKKGKRKKKKKK